jgi:hypothetical protein
VLAGRNVQQDMVKHLEKAMIEAYSKFVKGSVPIDKNGFKFWHLTYHLTYHSKTYFIVVMVLKMGDRSVLIELKV